MHTAKTLTGKDVVLRRCKQSDVQRHFDRIVDVIEPKLRMRHKDKMVKCVEEGTAYVTEGDECFLYYEKTKKSFSDGISIYGKGHPNLMTALMSGVFLDFDKETLFMYLRLHDGKDINEYKGFLSKSTMYRHRKNGDRLIVRVDHLRDKFRKLTSRGNRFE